MNLEELERGAIERSLRGTRGVQKDAGDLLDVPPRVLNYKIQVQGIDWKTFRKNGSFRDLRDRLHQDGPKM